MIKRRITALTKLVSQFDDSYILNFDETQKEKYLETLDIESLGSLKELVDMPTIFKVKPLTPEYEYLINGGEVNPWHIFSTHLESVEYFDVKLEFDKQGVLDSKHHDDFPARVIQDIAHMIVSLANRSGSEVFFMQSVASLRYTQAVKIKAVSKKAIENARTVDAQNKNSK